MKKFAIALLAVALLSVSSISIAEVVATMKMRNGKMFITDIACPNGKGKVGMIIAVNVSKINFCWSYDVEEDLIYVFYEDGDARMYPGDNFMINPNSKLYKQIQKEEPSDSEGTFL